MLAISDKVVIRADDLLTWCDESIGWHWGLKANGGYCPMAPVISDGAYTKKIGTEEPPHLSIKSLKHSQVDFSDVEEEKGKQQFRVHI